MVSECDPEFCAVHTRGREVFSFLLLSRSLRHSDSIRSGAFEHHKQENVSPDANPVLYIDRAGSTHKELDKAQENGTDEMPMPKGHRKGTILTASPSTLTVIPPPDDIMLKHHSREVATLQQKPIVAHWGRSACGKQACKGRVTARIGFINQPKRGL